MSTRLPRDLTHGADGEEFVALYEHNKILRIALVNYLKGELKRLLIKDEEISCYDSFNLSELRADNRGERRGIRAAIKLLNGDNIVEE